MCMSVGWSAGPGLLMNPPKVAFLTRGQSVWWKVHGAGEPAGPGSDAASTPASCVTSRAVPDRASQSCLFPTQL